MNEVHRGLTWFWEDKVDEVLKYISQWLKEEFSVEIKWLAFIYRYTLL